MIRPGRQTIFTLLLISLTGTLNAQAMIREYLHQDWQFRQLDQGDWLPASVPGTVHTDLLANERIGAPFYRTNERDLQWIDKADWEYRTTFTPSDVILARRQIELIFKGLDTYADVFLNEQLIIQADNFFVEWRVDIKPLLRPGVNKLRIHFHSPIHKGLQLLKAHGFGLPAINDQSVNGGLKKEERVSVFTRKPGYHYGWDWGPRLVPSGIWRPVVLEAWDSVRLADLFFFQQSVSTERCLVEARFTVEADGVHEFHYSVRNEDKTIASQVFTTKPGLNTFTIPFYIEQPKLWWTRELGEPHLYRLTGQIARKEETVDEASHEVGLRTIEVVQEKDEKGASFFFKLNGRPIFAKGANYIPNDVFIPRVTEDQYQKVIQSAADANMNMLRVWGGGFYENDLFYQLCDRAGILVWQDFMFACSMYPGNEDFLQKVKAEAVYNVKRLRNHPSIALWCGNNEMDVAWSQHKEFGGWWWKQQYGRRKRRKIWKAYETVFHQLLPATVERYAPGVFYWPSSPYAGPGEHSFPKATKGDIHYWGVWHGKEPFIAFQENIGRFMSEYGFQSFPEFKAVRKYTLPEDWDIESDVMVAHQRSGIGNLRIRSYMEDHYRVPDRFEHLLYVGQLLQAKGMRIGMEAHRAAKPYCMGSLYWQLNDCWPVASWSGMDYYQNWKAFHYAARASFAPVIITAQRSRKKLDVYVVSDREEDFPAVLSYRLLQFNGEECWQYEQPLTVPTDRSVLVNTWKLSELQKKAALPEVVMEITLRQADTILSESLVYLTDEKHLSLPPNPGIQATVSTDAPPYRIDIITDKLAKNVFLEFPEVNGFFSDNYLDLLPGKVYQLTFVPDSSISPIDLPSLSVLSLVDTY